MAVLPCSWQSLGYEALASVLRTHYRNNFSRVTSTRILCYGGRS